MLDVHPPHEPTHTWRDFFIHIATICVGLLIAIALEQSVEALHHRHQREYLEQQIHDESERNLQLVTSELQFVGDRSAYAAAIQQALEDAPRSGDGFLFTMPVDPAPFPAILISPSRGTWAVATAAGTVALLPAETAKVYYRLNLVGEFEQEAEAAMMPATGLRTSSLLRAHVPLRGGVRTQLAAQQRDDLIFAASQCLNAINDLQFRLAVQQGALEAVLHGARTLEEMYPYQQRAMAAAGVTGHSSRLTAPQAESH